ncbi:MAG: Gfo/Idh/MocA family protein [Halothece sp.]
MSNSSLGVAIVGTGFGKKVHLPAFQIHEETKPVAVYNRSLDKARAIAQENEIPHASNDLNTILSLPDVDAVSVTTPPFLHYDMAKAVINAGKHLLLEKPLNLNAQQTRELYHLAKEKGVVAASDFEFRFVPEWQMLAEYLEKDYVGNKRLVKIDWLLARRANPELPWNWYAQKDKGGGALGAVGSHAFDYLNWLFGGINRLCGQLSTAVSERPDPQDNGKLKPVDSDDTCLLMLELADGTPCQLNISAAAYEGRGHWVEVYGDRATIVLGSPNLKDYVHGFRFLTAPAGESLSEVFVPQRLGFPKVYQDGRIAPVVRLIDQWVQAIKTNKPMTPSLREGAYSQLLMDLTHQSHQQRGWVDVPDFDKFLGR